MTTYILHGGGMHAESESNDRFYRRILEAVPEGGTILLSYFASEKERWDELFAATKIKIAAQAGDKAVNCVRATEEGFLDELRAADAVIFRGGSTNRLLGALKAYPHLKEALDGKIVAGSSAGTYVLSAFNYDRSDMAMREGLGFVPVRSICHYGSETKDGVGDEAVEAMNKMHTDLPLVILRDAEWKEFSI